MGYYVTGEGYLAFKDGDAAYKAACELNKLNSKKRGGQYGAEALERYVPDGEPSEYKWFSWMDPFYDTKCKDVWEILEMLGFGNCEAEKFYQDEIAPNVRAVTYDNKTGQEDLFLQVMAPYIVNGSEIRWVGEEGAHWRWRFVHGSLSEEHGKRGRE